MNPTLQTALTCWANDIVTIPVATGTNKRPALNWKQFQNQPPTIEQVNDWFTTHDGIGIITGQISGNLIMVELEGRVTEQQINDLHELGHDTSPELWQKLTTTWADKSPSGGTHYYLRLALTSDETMPRNTKIARNHEGEVLAETRAAGGFAVIAPTPGQFHPTGKPWEPLTGNPTTTQTITLDQLATITALIHATLDETPEPEQPANVNPIWKPGTTHTGDGDLKPGDDYENQTDWTEILEPHGWTLAYQRGNQRYWTRPGKTEGVSATTGHAQERDRLYVFTSSTTFEPETPYTKFGAYTLLNHAGDHTAAARELADKGYGHRAPRQIPATTTPTSDGNHDAIITPITTATAPKLQPTTITSDPEALTDLGNAQLTAQRHHQRIRYIADANRWAEWTGTRWQWSPDNAPAIQAAIETIQQIPTDSQDLAKHRKRSLNTRALTNNVTLLRTMSTIRTTADTFDQHPYELNTPGGTVNLRTGQLQPHNPTHYHSMTTRHTPTPGAPKWETFIAWTMHNNQQMVRYLQQLAGISLIGEVLEPVLPFLHGRGANGKSVFLETIRETLGDYAIESKNALLLTGPNQHPTELANLRGRRLVVMSEVNEGDRFDEAKLKTLTGGDAISARFMRQDFFTFTPTHTLWLLGNHKPTVQSGGDSFWRRLVLIPFDNQKPKNERNPNLKNELLEEAPGILQWLVDGCVDYLNNGLTEPEIVKQATEEYEHEEDSLARFIEDRVLLVDKAARIDQSEFRRAYKQWCDLNDERELNATAFGRALKTRYGVETSKNNGRRQYRGVMLTNEDTSESIWR